MKRKVNCGSSRNQVIKVKENKKLKIHLRIITEENKVNKGTNDAEADNREMTENLRIYTLMKLSMPCEGRSQTAFLRSSPLPRKSGLTRILSVPSRYGLVHYAEILVLKKMRCLQSAWIFLAVSKCFPMVWKANGKLVNSKMRSAPKPAWYAKHFYHIWSVTEGESITETGRMENKRFFLMTAYVLDVDSSCVVISQ